MPPKSEISTEADAVAAIEGAGYTNVTNVEQHGATWHATAQNSAGSTVGVLIDGAGHVKEKGGDDDEPHPEQHT